VFFSKDPIFLLFGGEFVTIGDFVFGSFIVELLCYRFVNPASFLNKNASVGSEKSGLPINFSRNAL